MKATYHRHFSKCDATVAAIAERAEPYVPVPRTEGSAFEVLGRAIAGQQLSTVVARKIIDRLIAASGGHFPPPAQLVTMTPEVLRAAGLSFAKIAALKDLAAHAIDGRLPDDATLAQMPDEEIIARCIAVRGIGPWTAQMLLMFHFGRPDVMPVDDFGVRNGFRLAYGLKGLPRPRALLAYAERWKPHRSAGAWYMWRAVELHQGGNLPKRSGRMPRIEVVPPKPKAGAGKVAGKVATSRGKPVAAAKRSAASAPRTPRPRRSAGINKAARAPRR